MSWTLPQLAELTGAEVRGRAGLIVHRPVDFDADDPAGIAFCERRKHLDRSLGVGAVIVPPDLPAGDRPHLVAAHPRLAFNRILEDYQRLPSLPRGRHPSAILDDSADIDPTVRIGPFVVVEPGARIAAGVQLFAFCYVGAGCVVGEDTVVHPRVALYREVRVGRRCVIHAGAVLGADGFGFLPVAGRYRKVPHVGAVASPSPTCASPGRTGVSRPGRSRRPGGSTRCCPGWPASSSGYGVWSSAGREGPPYDCPLGPNPGPWAPFRLTGDDVAAPVRRAHRLPVPG